MSREANVSWRTIRVLVGSALLIGLLGLASCGGGGSGGEPPSIPPPAVPTPLPDLSIQAVAQADLSEAVAFKTSAAPAAALRMRWDFGDGTSSTDAAPQHLFERAGDLSVKLTLSNEVGTEKTYSHNISVSNKALTAGLSCDGGPWCWARPITSGNRIHDIQFADAQTGWRAGARGELFKTSDGGKTWVQQSFNTAIDVRQISIHSKQDLLVSIQELPRMGNWQPLKEYQLSQDGGTSWQNCPPYSGLFDYQLEPMPLGQGRVLSARPERWSGTAIVYYHASASAAKQELDYGNYQLLSVGKDGSILTLIDGNIVRRASALAAPELRYTLPSLGRDIQAGEVGLVRSSDKVVWLVQVHPRIAGDATVPMKLHRSVDGGQNWESIQPQFSSEFLAHWLAADPNRTAPPLPRLLSSDAGGNKIAMMGWGPGRLDYVWPSWPNYGMVENALRASDDGGRNWTRRAAASDDRGMVCSAWETRISCDASDKAFTSTDFGITQTAIVKPFAYGSAEYRLRAAGAALTVSIPSGAYLAAFDGSTWTPLHAAYQLEEEKVSTAPSFGTRREGRMILNSSLYASSDGGKHWTEAGRLLSDGDADAVAPLSAMKAGQTMVSLAAVEMSDGQTIYLLPQEGPVRLSRDGGQSWQRPPVFNQSGLQIEQLRFQDRLLGWARGYQESRDRPRLFITRDGGRTWLQTPSVPNPVMTVLVGADKELNLIGSGGEVQRSLDDGASWTRQPAPPLTVSKSFVHAGKTIWVVGNGNELQRSDDKGLSWQRLASVPVNSGVSAMCFSSPQIGWVAMFGGTMWHTRDGGASWRPQYPPSKRNLSSLNCLDDLTVWAGGHYTVMVTGSGG